MQRRKTGLETKKRILAVCVKLFLEQGYKNTTVAQIREAANVSNSSFQNLFQAKDGVLTELAQFMFERQFHAARETIGKVLPPVYVYAVETAIQLTLTEVNENLREIYVEAYTQEKTKQYIYEKTTEELYQIFGGYQPELTKEDFYLLEIGSAGMMRSYMEYVCDERMTLQGKIEAFLKLSLSAYKVTEKEQKMVLALINKLDVKEITEQMMHQLIESLAVHYDFSLEMS